MTRCLSVFLPDISEVPKLPVIFNNLPYLHSRFMFLSQFPCKKNNPCQNNGACVPNFAQHDYYCDCHPGFAGIFCERTGKENRYSVFLLQFTEGNVTGYSALIM